ncbi:fasciclin domain-containing protein [Ginsengibacter hankyongi]|uniref:Fasciclin domain-containing protein n=1 Tax=Ginsengibacter hankyongi TaxID=2607284 RepID=A0A5J5IIE4_9BACT|nr:fasciclin domain-containing protein [Ginsengibacter hankyongi]KAA9040815.1 fasciclin domain-containing protein [Ginsengibacter hankyongi]
MKSLSSNTVIKAILFIFVIGLSATSCKKEHNKGPKSIYGTISNDPNYSFLTAAVNKAGLVSALNDGDKSSLTLFAPSNDAFIAAGFKTPTDLAGIPDTTLKAILLYHVLGSKVEAAQIPQASNTAVATLNGQPAYATRTIDGKVYINGVSVIKANIECTNGVIHDINRVLIPAMGTIVQTAISNPNFSLLVAAVLRASQGTTNVATVLSGAGPFTVFAPTNLAFINAGFADAAAINAADPNTLTSILTYHVIAGRIFSSDLTNGATPATVNGGKVTITLTSGAKVKGNGNATPSNIIATDIVTTNGVIHVIDQVLLP